ncbi:MAG: sensor histidine kinase [Saprospiraceae bacterium]
MPVDSVLRGDSARILSIASEASLVFYLQDGSTVAVRDMRSNSPLVNDRISIKLTEELAVNGFFIAYVKPTVVWVPSTKINARYGLHLLSTPADEYEILGTHFDLNLLRSREASMFFLLGGIFLLGCYFGMLFFSNPEEHIFGIYAAYLFFHTIYWAERITTISIPFFSRGVDQIVVNTVSQICFHVAFTLLAHELLNFRKYYPTIGRVWRMFAAAQLGFAVLFTVSIYAGFDAVALLNAFALERSFIGIVALLTIFYFVVRPHNIYCYFLGFASFSFVGSALVSLFLGNINFFAVGLGIEILTFAFAIGHKIRKADESRIENEKSAFMLEREVIRTKDAALRAQMNPHFVSNVINALRALILEGENKQAYSYLSRFAHVVRTMLGSADKQLIPLSEELRLLKDYVALEELRFGRKVEFVFKVSDEIDVEGVLIPPMLLQPLVENAMHHGLFPLTEREPRIVLDVSTEESSDALNITVSDNGIGRSRAAETQLKRKRQRPSMAMNIIRERIKLLQEGSSVESRKSAKDALIVEDLLDDNETGIGTRITLKIPRTILKDQLRTLLDSKKNTSRFSFLLREESKQHF